MLFKIFKQINNLFVSAETFNRHINHYKLISKEPALPSYAYINWGMYLINTGNKQKGLEKLNQRHPDLNITMDNYQDKLYSWIGGGFVMKGVKKLEKQMWRRMHKHERKFLSKFKNLVNALEYEMGNHECSYTGEYTNCLPPLGFSYQDLKKNKRLRKAFIIARNNQYEWYKKHGW